ncbi:MAG: hypothetical protein JWO39_1758 [Gemmatimonadetes bacterium]|nr:hypothetical protein [Gemmatimonadota bacterium]
MRRFAFISLALIAPVMSRAQGAPSRATRADGSTVVLFPDGTWRPDSGATTIRVAAGVASYTTPAADTDQLDLGRGVTLHFNPAKWQRTPPTAPGRLQLRHVDGDGYAMIISERLQVPAAALRNIVITNAKNAAPDLKITMDEQRRVNGVEVEALQFTGTAQGVPFHWYGYYFSGKAGAIQVITFSGESLFDGFKTDFQDLLNGFQVAQQ